MAMGSEVVERTLMTRTLGWHMGKVVWEVVRGAVRERRVRVRNFISLVICEMMGEGNEIIKYRAVLLRR
jgi:hypothetical protein